jgi:hypothetical protein
MAVTTDRPQLLCIWREIYCDDGPLSLALYIGNVQLLKLGVEVIILLRAMVSEGARGAVMEGKQ